MKKILLFTILSLFSMVSSAQSDCEIGYFLVSEEGYETLDASSIERSLKTLDTNCIETNAEYGEVANEYIFMCLTYCVDSLFSVLAENKCKSLYNLVLNEIESPVSDSYNFQVIFCNIDTYRTDGNNKIREQILSRFKDGITNTLSDHEVILQSNCQK